MWNRAQRTAYSCLLVILMSGCSNHRALQTIATESQFTKKVIYSSLFSHTVYFNQQYGSGDRQTLYVFLEGDGIPWKTRTQISVKPDPVYPLALDLMSKNRHPSVYLQRPCYGTTDENCHFKYWTNRRYSQEVVISMVQVIQDVSAEYQQVVLVGYSGGGAIAALIARQLRKVSQLITLAGNMDHRQWTKYHSYSDLQGSLNAIDYTLPASLHQFHYAAEYDKNIMPQWIKKFSDKQINSQFILVKNIDHSCCWVEKWPAIVKQTKLNPLN